LVARHEARVVRDGLLASRELGLGRLLLRRGLVDG
jgi:hypothetical protein